MTEDQTSYVVHRHEAPPKPVAVKLESHGAPGTDKHYFAWEISAAGASVAEVLATLREANAALKQEYGNHE